MQRDKKNTYKYGEYRRAVQENNSKNAINIPLRICEKKILYSASMQQNCSRSKIKNL